MSRGRVQLTVLGRALLLSAAALGLGGLLFGVQELYPVAAAGGVLVASSWLWLRIKVWDVSVTRHIHPGRVPAGSDARVELTVRNMGLHRSPPIFAGDPFDGGKRWARFVISPLGSGEMRVASYRLPTTRRGVFRLGPLELEVTDPFSLVRTKRSSTPDTSLTVHPKVEAVSTRSISTRTNSDMRLPQPVIGSGGNEFYGLRTYVTGDDLRHVHWPSTARLDDLVIRQPENLWRGRITVAVDLRSWVHDNDSLETLLSAVASLAISTLAAGMQVRVVTTSGIDTGYASSPQHGPAILDLLAAAVPMSGDSLASSMRMVRGSDTTVVCTTDSCVQADLAETVRTGGTSTSVVVVERHRDNRVASQAAVAARMVRVPVGGSFRAAWEATP